MTQEYGLKSHAKLSIWQSEYPLENTLPASVVDNTLAV